MRFGLAGAVIVALRGWPRVRPAHLLLPSVCAISIPYSLSYLGLSRLGVSVKVLLVQLEAPILIVLSAIVLHEIPRRSTGFGVALAVIGVLLVAGRPSAEGQALEVLVVIASMVVWAFGQIQIRRLGLEGGGLRLLGALAILAAPQLLMISLIFETGHLETVAGASFAAWSQILYLGLVMTGLGLGTWYFLVARYPLHLVAPFLLLVPICSVAGGVLFLGETLAASTLAGGLMMLTGVAIATLRLSGSPTLGRVWAGLRRR